MSLLGSRRRKKSRNFEILIIPQGDGGGTKDFKFSSTKAVLWGSAALMVLFLVFLLVFRYTPLGRLTVTQESTMSAAEMETERRIRALAEEMAVLREYNTNLRKALGEQVEKSEPSVSTQPAEEEQNQTPSTESENLEQTELTPVQQVAGSGGEHLHVEALAANFPLFAPVSGIVTQGFEPNQKHFGIDYAAKEGTPVHAANQGYVIFAGWTYDYGYTIILSHGSGYVSVYKHNSSLLKTTGAFVRRGELLCLVGSSGRTSRGPHLHFEVLKDGIPLDPSQFLLNAKPL